jgi:hypothetical protein
MRPIIALIALFFLASCDSSSGPPSAVHTPPGWPNQHTPAASGPGVDAGQGAGWCGQLYGKLRACGFLSQGEFNCWDTDETDGTVQAYLSCMASCIVMTSCVALESYYCGDDDTDTIYGCFLGCEAKIPQFTCPDGEQLPVSWKCDGWEDCEDGSDELGCPPGSVFQCDGDYSVPQDWVCDGDEDCDDGSDEYGCPAGSFFQCADGEQIEASWHCDGEEDCYDGSDEFGCASWTLPCMQSGGGGGGGVVVVSEDGYSYYDDYDGYSYYDDYDGYSYDEDADE